MSIFDGDVAEDIVSSANEAISELVGDGLSQEEAASIIAGMIDAAVPINQIINGGIGNVIERLDGPVIEKIVAMVLEALKPDPDNMHSRALDLEEKADALEQKKPKRAKRLRRRAERLRNRADWLSEHGL